LAQIDRTRRFSSIALEYSINGRLQRLCRCVHCRLFLYLDRLAGLLELCDRFFGRLMQLLLMQLLLMQLLPMQLLLMQLL